MSSAKNERAKARQARARKTAVASAPIDPPTVIVALEADSTTRHNGTHAAGLRNRRASVSSRSSSLASSGNGKASALTPATRADPVVTAQGAQAPEREGQSASLPNAVVETVVETVAAPS